MPGRSSSPWLHGCPGSARDSMHFTVTSASVRRFERRAFPRGMSSSKVLRFATASVFFLVLSGPGSAAAECAVSGTTPRLDVPAITCEVGEPCVISIDLSLADPPDEETIKTAIATLTSDKAITCTACSVETPAGYGNCAFNPATCGFFLGDAFDQTNELSEGTIASISLTCDVPGSHDLDLETVSFGSPAGSPVEGCGQAATLTCEIPCAADGDCAALDDPCNVGVCSSGTDTCTTIPRDDGAPCSLCPETLDSFCHTASRAKLDYNEKKAGKEQMGLRWQKIQAAISQADFGDPIGDDTVVSSCIYDDSGSLVHEFSVARAGDDCAGKPCWKSKGTRGYGYIDKDGSSSGVSKVDYLSGDVGRGKAAVKGKNDEKKGLTQLPAGLASALSGNVAPTIQMITDSGFCVGATLNDIRDDGPSRYRAQKR